jgi:ankyrin repeat protein
MDGGDDHSMYVSHYATLLHAVLHSSGRIPLEIIQCIVDKGGVELAIKKNIDGDTPLHIAVTTFPRRSDIAAFLIQQAPQVVQERNDIQFRPIDLLSHKVIMIDECQKYSYGTDVDMDEMWKTVHCVASASRSDIKCRQPLLHACIVCPGFPVALLPRAIQRYPEQLNEADGHGDLPLHLMVSKPRDSDDEEDIVEMNLFSMILQKNINAATALNHDGMSPLALAIQNGYGCNASIVRAVLSHAPASLGTLELPLPVLPFLYQRLVEENLWSAVFVLVRATPLG